MEREKEREREPSLSRVAARDVARGCLLSLAVHFSPVSLSLSLSLFFLLLIPSSPFSLFNLSLSLSLFSSALGERTKRREEKRAERRGTRIKGGKERERKREEVAHFLLCLSIGEGSPRTLFFRSLSLSFQVSSLSSESWLAASLSHGIFELLALSIRSPSPLVYPAAPAEASYGSFAPLPCLRLYTFSLSLSFCLSLCWSALARTSNRENQ